MLRNLLISAVTLSCLFRVFSSHAQDVYYQNGLLKIRHPHIRSIYKPVWFVLQGDSSHRMVMKLLPFMWNEKDSQAFYSIVSEKREGQQDIDTFLRDHAALSSFILLKKKDLADPASAKRKIATVWHAGSDTSPVKVSSLPNAELQKFPNHRLLPQHPGDLLRIEHITLVTDGVYADQKYLNQGLKNAYVRTTLAARLNIAGMPVTFTSLVSTENNSGLNQLNNFRLSFDQYAFRENLRKRMEQQQSAYDQLSGDKSDKLLNEKLEKLLNDSAFAQKQDQNGKPLKSNYPDLGAINAYKRNLGYHMSETDEKLARMNKKIADPGYSKDIAVQEKLIGDAEKDPSLKRTNKYRQAVQKMEKHRQLSNDHRFYSQLKDILKQYQAAANVEKLKDAGDLRKQKRLAGKGYRYLLALKRFEIGTFNPAYSSLMLDGVNMNGLNVEFNEGHFYTAFAGGYTDVNFNNPYELNVGGKRSILAGRLGYGKTDKALFAVTFLRGTDMEKNSVSDAAYSYYQPGYNNVLGMQFTYRIEKRLVLDLEYARSLGMNMQPPGGKGFSDAIGALIRKEIPYANAYSGKLTYTSGNARTRLSLLCRQVDPMYFSFGAAMLRHDNFRTEAKLDQKIYKNILSGSSSIKYDNDNLYGFKSGTSTIISSVNTLSARLMRSLMLTGIYSPIRQSYYITAQQRSLVSFLHLTSLVANYAVSHKNITSNTTIGLSRFWNNDRDKFEGDTSAAVKISQYNVSLTQMLTFRRQEITVMGNTNYIKQGKMQDSSDVFTGTASVTYKVFKKKIVITNGATFQHDLHTEKRYIGFYSIGFTLNKFLTVNLTHDIQIVRNFENESKNLNNICRINILTSIR